MTRFGLFISCRCHCIKSCQLLPSVITAVQALTKSPVGHPSHTEPPSEPTTPLAALQQCQPRARQRRHCLQLLPGLAPLVVHPTVQ